MIWRIFSSAEGYPDVEVGKENGFVDLTFCLLRKVNLNRLHCVSFPKQFKKQEN